MALQRSSRRPNPRPAPRSTPSTRLAGSLLGAALLLGAQAASAQMITYGPILGRGQSGDSMIVKWGTQNSGDSTKVSYRVKGAASFTSVTGMSAKDHEVVLKGLTLGQVYEYNVTSGTQTSMTYSFSTCPLPGRPMDMVFYGDSRSDPSAHAKVLAQVAKQSPEMVMESGDIAPIGSYDQYLMEFFPTAKSLVATTAFMAAPGNHDAPLGEAGMRDNYARVFPTPRADGAAWKPYYAFSCGNAVFLSLNSNDIGNAEQLAFIKDQLDRAKKNPDVDHVLVWFHHAPYSPGSHGDNGTIQSQWVPLFNAPDSKVTAVFSGHDHIYARMDDSSPVFYVVSGGAGAGLYSDTARSKATKVKSKSAYNFVSVHLAGPLFSAVAYDDSGTELDRFTLTRSPLPPTDGGLGPRDLSAGPADLGMDPADLGTGNADLAVTPPPPDNGCAMTTHSAAAARPLGLLSALGALGVWVTLRRRRRALRTA